MKRLYFLVLLAITLSFLIDCSENPLFKDEDISSGGTEIRGKVNLNDHSSPDNVFIWLEGFNICTYSDSQGNFLLRLPPASNQPGEGINGLYNIYYYVANYCIDSSKVYFHSGRVEFSKGDINNKGELKSTKSLSKLLEIKTIVEPSIILKNYQGEISISVSLRALSGSVNVTFYEKVGSDFMGAGFIKFIEGNSVNYLDLTSIHNISKTIGNSERIWRLYHEIQPSRMAIGHYEIIPYIVVHQPGIPPKLKEKIGVDIEKFDLNYLNLPFKQDNGKFKIIKDS